jgi:hypothetical protein
MWVTYCKEDLPTKVVVAWAAKETTAQGLKCGGHDDLNPDPENSNDWEPSCGEFELTDVEWDAVHVHRDSAQTAANIIANHGDKFVA